MVRNDRTLRTGFVSVLAVLFMLFSALGAMTAVGANSPPDIMSTPSTYAYTGMLYEYQVLAIDFEDTQLNYTLFFYPDGMKIDSKTGLITWTPTASQVGTNIVGIAVYDKMGAKDMQNYTIEVYEPPPPYIEIYNPTWGQEVSATIYIKGMVFAGFYDMKGAPYNISIKLKVEVFDQNKVAVASWDELLVIDYSDYNRTAGEWKFEFDTKKVSDGKYFVIATASDMNGLSGTAQVDFSIDNTHANDVVWFDKPQDQWTFKEPYVSFAGGANKNYNITSVQIRIDYAYTDPGTQVVLDWTKVSWSPYTWNYGFNFSGYDDYGMCYIVRLKAVNDVKELGGAKIMICMEGVTPPPPPPPSKIKVSIDSPMDGSVVSGSFELKFQVYYESKSTITAYVGLIDSYGQGTSLVFNGITDGQSALTFSSPVDSTMFNDGKLSVYVNVTADTGAYGYASITLVVNNYVPPPSDFKMWVEKPVDGMTVSGKVEIMYAAVPSTDGTLTGLLTIEDSRKMGINTSFTGVAKKDQQLTWTYTLDTTILNDGPAYIYGKAEITAAGGQALAYFRIMINIQNNVVPPPPPPGKLEIQFVSPSDGSTVKGAVKFTGKTYYADNVRTLQLTIFLDGNEYVKVFSTGGGWKEFTFEVDTTKLKDGVHGLNATCEINGLRAAAHMKFIVNNGGSPPPPPVPPPVIPGGEKEKDGSITVDEKKVEFEAPTYSGMDNNNMNYTWDFGDGTISHDKNPTHTYKDGGSYDVKLKVTDGITTKESSVDLNVGRTPVYKTTVPGFGATALVLGLMLGCVAAFFRRRK